MAFCEQCGAQIADDSVFCEQCGTRQSAIARQIPAVEVDPREESAEETPLPEQPVGGNRSIRLLSGRKIPLVLRVFHAEEPDRDFHLPELRAGTRFRHYAQQYATRSC